MTLTRRALLQSGTVLGTAMAVGLPALLRSSAAAAPPVARAAGTTLAARLALGAPGAGGYAPVVAAPGEPHVVRADLGATPAQGRIGTRVPVVSFAHLTDVHIIDAQSPMRVEYLDRLDDSTSRGTRCSATTTDSCRATSPRHWPSAPWAPALSRRPPCHRVSRRPTC